MDRTVRILSAAVIGLTVFAVIMLVANLAQAHHGGGGENGPTVIVGTSGSDKLVGGHGPDVLIGKAGDDRLWGGRGPDTFRCGPGVDTVHNEFDTGNDTLVACEVVVE